MAGNDTQGLRYGTIETPEKHYLSWKEENPDYHPQVDGREQKYLPWGGPGQPLPWPSPFGLAEASPYAAYSGVSRKAASG